MESLPLDMDEIFENGGDGDDFPSALPDLPPDLEPLENNDGEIPPTQDAENAEVLAKLKGMKGAGKRVVRRPMPKLDANRLTGDRGIATLPGFFKDVKLKGKGHETEDLRVIMKLLENWTHRLFPSMPFDEAIERIERLGSKAQVQTCVKKMRLDIPILTQDFLPDEDEVDGDDETPVQNRKDGQDFDAEAAFDEIMQEERDLQAQSQQPPLTSLLATPTQPPPSPAAAAAASLTNGMTPEQKERMERNKRLAMEKRAARLAKQNAKSTEENTDSNSTPQAATDKTQAATDNSRDAVSEDSTVVAEPVGHEDDEPLASSMAGHEDTVSVEQDRLEDDSENCGHPTLEVSDEASKKGEPQAEQTEESLRNQSTCRSDTDEDKQPVTADGRLENPDTLQTSTDFNFHLTDSDEHDTSMKERAESMDTTELSKDSASADHCEKGAQRSDLIDGQGAVSSSVISSPNSDNLSCNNEDSCVPQTSNAER